MPSLPVPVLLQTNSASIPSSTTRTCRKSPNTSWSATWTPLDNRAEPANCRKGTRAHARTHTCTSAYADTRRIKSCDPCFPSGTSFRPWTSWRPCCPLWFSTLGQFHAVFTPLSLFHTCFFTHYTKNFSREKTSDFSSAPKSIYLFIFKNFFVPSHLPSMWSWISSDLLRFKSIVGIGVGAGAYVLAKFAVSRTLIFMFWMKTKK